MPERPDPRHRIITALLTARPEKQEELSNTLQVLMAGSRVQPGCLDAMVGRELGGAGRFILHMTWEDRPFLEAYLASDAFRVLRGAARVLTEPTHSLRFTSHHAEVS